MKDDDERVVRGALWPRFDSYEITEGFVHPAKNARFELYDPWEEYVTVWQRRQRSSRKKDDHAGSKRNNPRKLPAYQELLCLASPRLEGDPKTGPAHSGEMGVTPGSRQRVLAWCRRNGLLGLLHQEILEIWLPPVWEADEYDQRGRLIAVVNGWQRAGAGWVHTRRYYTDVEDLGRSLCGAPVPRARHAELHASRVEALRSDPIGLYIEAPMPKSIGETIAPSGGLVLRSQWGDGLEVAPLHRLGHYRIPNQQAGEEPSWPLPNPHDEEFWRSYREPLSEIAFATRRLGWIMETVATNSPKYARPSAQQQEKSSRALGDLATFTENTWPRVVLEEGRPQVRWSAPSLLGRLALMITFDLAGRGTVRTCAGCGTPFVSSAPQAVYCSDRCRNTVQQRRFREKRRLAAMAEPSR
jgi:hypothetical protein